MATTGVSAKGLLRAKAAGGAFPEDHRQFHLVRHNEIEYLEQLAIVHGDREDLQPRPWSDEFRERISPYLQELYRRA